MIPTQKAPYKRELQSVDKGRPSKKAHPRVLHPAGTPDVP